MLPGWPRHATCMYLSAADDISPQSVQDSLEFSSMIAMYSYDLVRTLLQYVCTQHLRIFIHLCRCTCLLPHMLTHGLLCFGLNFPRPMSMTWEFSPVHCMYWYATGENSKPGIPCTLYMYAPVVNSPMCIPWTCALATIENSKPCMPCTFTCMLQLWILTSHSTYMYASYYWEFKARYAMYYSCTVNLWPFQPFDLVGHWNLCIRVTKDASLKKKLQIIFSALHSSLWMFQNILGVVVEKVEDLG